MTPFFGQKWPKVSKKVALFGQKVPKKVPEYMVFSEKSQLFDPKRALTYGFFSCFFSENTPGHLTKKKCVF